MKTKKIFTFLFCYFILLAFIAVICFDVSSGSGKYHQKSTISKGQGALNTELHLLFEENDSENFVSHDFLSQPFFVSDKSLAVPLSASLVSTSVPLRLPAKSKQPLFISQRSLRL